MMKLISTIACGLLAASVATVPASAATIFFNNGGSSSSSTTGNVRTYSAGGISVKATAFSYNGSSLSAGFLGQYGTDGLGVINNLASDGSTTDDSHTVDNSGNRDFILLIFDSAVNISGAVLNPFTTAGSTDNDAWVSFGTLAGAYTTAPNTSNAIFTTLGSNANGKNVVGSGSSALTNFNTGGNSGNVWMISAARADKSGWDGTIDSFKLGSIIVTQTNAVPEPATWAMMIVGFGTVGATMRRRRRIAAGMTATA